MYLDGWVSNFGNIVYNITDNEFFLYLYMVKAGVEKNPEITEYKAFRKILHFGDWREFFSHIAILVCVLS